MFAVVLEYCCLTDYKMLITNITDEHSRTIEELNTQFDEKCKKFLESETFLKQNIAGLKADQLHSCPAGRTAGCMPGFETQVLPELG